jgi:hypothetical protein
MSHPTRGSALMRPGWTSIVGLLMLAIAVSAPGLHHHRHRRQ